MLYRSFVQLVVRAKGAFKLGYKGLQGYLVGSIECLLLYYIRHTISSVPLIEKSKSFSDNVISAGNVSVQEAEASLGTVKSPSTPPPQNNKNVRCCQLSYSSPSTFHPAFVVS